MVPSAVVYLVLTFTAHPIDPEPSIVKYEDVQQACEVASHTIYPFTVWMYEHYDRTQCCDDNFATHEYRDVCKQDPSNFMLNFCPQHKEEVIKMRCVSSPSFKLEADDR